MVHLRWAAMAHYAPWMLGRLSRDCRKFGECLSQKVRASCWKTSDPSALPGQIIFEHESLLKARKSASILGRQLVGKVTETLNARYQAQSCPENRTSLRQSPAGSLALPFLRRYRWPQEGSGSDELRTLITLAMTAALAGCGQSEPRSLQYFESHPDEARKVVAACKEDAQRGDECQSAMTAVETAEAREKFKRFRGK